MATWGNVKREIEEGNRSLDIALQDAMRAVEVVSNRPLIVYATDFNRPAKVQASRGEISIDNTDLLGFDEVTENLEGDVLDVMIQSPGGAPEAAEGIVDFLRSRFNHIRFFVPGMAKSAATMICCSGNEVWMDVASELGPIDPQLISVRPNGSVASSPAQLILKQFEFAKSEIAENPADLAAWVPILQPLGPSLLKQCEAAIQLSQQLAQDWLEQYMFANEPNPHERAVNLAAYLNAADHHRSHARRIGIRALEEQGMIVRNFRENHALRTAMRRLYYTVDWLFDKSPTFKLMFNSRGDIYIREIIVQTVAAPIAQQRPVDVAPALPAAPARRRR